MRILLNSHSATPLGGRSRGEFPSPLTLIPIMGAFSPRLLIRRFAMLRAPILVSPLNGEETPQSRFQRAIASSATDPSAAPEGVPAESWARLPCVLHRTITSPPLVRRLRAETRFCSTTASIER